MRVFFWSLRHQMVVTSFGCGASSQDPVEEKSVGREGF